MGASRQSRVPLARNSSHWVATVGWGPAGADGTSTKSSGLAGTAGGRGVRSRHLFFQVDETQP